MNDFFSSSTSEFLKNQLNFIEDNILQRIFASAFVILLFWLLNKSISKLLTKKVEKTENKYRWSKFFNYTFVVISVFIVGRIWFAGVQSLATFLGLFSAGLAIALKDLIVNVAAWLFIIWRKPFNTGDRIQIGDLSGDVIDIRPFQFTILEIGNWVDAEQSTGRMIHIPNGKIFEQSIANYESGFEFIWNELKVLITFESDWQQAKDLLTKIIDKESLSTHLDAEKQMKRAAHKYLITYKKLTPIVYTSVEKSGVLLTIRYLCKPRKRRVSENVLWEKILTEVWIL